MIIWIFIFQPSLQRTRASKTAARGPRIDKEEEKGANNPREEVEVEAKEVKVEQLDSKTERDSSSDVEIIEEEEEPQIFKGKARNVSSVADLDPDPVGSCLFGSPGSGSFIQKKTPII